MESEKKLEPKINVSEEEKNDAEIESILKHSREQGHKGFDSVVDLLTDRRQRGEEYPFPGRPNITWEKLDDYLRRHKKQE